MLIYSNLAHLRGQILRKEQVKLSNAQHLWRHLCYHIFKHFIAKLSQTQTEASVLPEISLILSSSTHPTPPRESTQTYPNWKFNQQSVSKRSAHFGFWISRLSMHILSCSKKRYLCSEKDKVSQVVLHIITFRSSKYCLRYIYRKFTLDGWKLKYQ